MFDHYLHDLHELPLLTAVEEVALAAELERLVEAHWRALLTYRPALPVVLAALEAQPDNGALARLVRAGTRAKAGARARLSQRLRRLDQDRVAQETADQAVHAALAENARAACYLARVARAKDAQRRAKNRFVAANLRLVIALARRYDKTSMPLADLVQEGNLGLIRAVDRFDHRRGFRFSTYAAWWIRHALNRALSNKSRLVRLPVHALDDAARIRRAVAANESATGACPSDQELAASAGMSVEKVALLQALARGSVPLSMDAQRGDDSEQTLHEVLPANDAGDPGEQVDLAHWRDELSELLGDLSSIEANTLRLRFGLDGAEEHTLRAIGERYNLSRERMRQIQNEALDKLRNALRRKRRQHDENEAA